MFYEISWENSFPLENGAPCGTPFFNPDLVVATTAATGSGIVRIERILACVIVVVIAASVAATAVTGAAVIVTTATVIAAATVTGVAIVVTTAATAVIVAECACVE